MPDRVICLRRGHRRSGEGLLDVRRQGQLPEREAAAQPQVPEARWLEGLGRELPCDRAWQWRHDPGELAVRGSRGVRRRLLQREGRCQWRQRRQLPVRMQGRIHGLKVRRVRRRLRGVPSLQRDVHAGGRLQWTWPCLRGEVDQRIWGAAGQLRLCVRRGLQRHRLRGRRWPDLSAGPGSVSGHSLRDRRRRGCRPGARMLLSLRVSGP
mmetsp:Transcript_98097/g.245852  ORF Transcript_98097/g.245852 Transcript_98097/m.245852 type:complete len:209 (+) Transcript_98097:1978-2604(+)